MIYSQTYPASYASSVRKPPELSVDICSCLPWGLQVNHTGDCDLLPIPSGILGLTFFVTGDRELAQGNPNPLPVEAEQLACTVSGEVELTLALSCLCWRRDIKVGWHSSSASGGTLLSHVFVWVQSLIQYALHQGAGSQ